MTHTRTQTHTHICMEWQLFVLPRSHFVSKILGWPDRTQLCSVKDPSVCLTAMSWHFYEISWEKPGKEDGFSRDGEISTKHRLLVLVSCLDLNWLLFRPFVGSGLYYVYLSTICFNMICIVRGWFDNSISTYV